ncbi:MAG: glycoside hydrolase family 3 C-terminal domain-containing protein [Bacteroidota bacterium]|nr:glycoside hydrolase family 3 C-terminal domain-containing protein [Bacteroidota bacterium]
MKHIFSLPFIFIFTSAVSISQTVQTIEDRITSILNQMTVQEKIDQLHPQTGFTTADNTRLKIPGFIMADGPHGVRDGSATCFPVGIAMAAMWDTSMAHRIGVAMGKEFRGKGKSQALGPCLDLGRDVRNGRSAESGGEDPYLDAQTTTAVVKGVQSTPAIATIKHYNANHRENGRTTNNIIAPLRSLTEMNGLTFRTAVQEGGAFSVMNAYNLINGEKCAENTTLLTTILRNYWGFPFYVVSDWGSIWDPQKAITAGCDLEMGSDLYGQNLPTLVANGTVSQATLDQAVRRVLRTKMLAGILDYQPEGNADDVNSLKHQQLCLDAARKSIILLKNKNNILPLVKDSITKILLIGPSAAVAQIDGGGSAYVTPFYSISPRQGIESKIGSAKVAYLKGCDINNSDTSGFAAARIVAAAADVVIFVGGLDPSQESEGMDRKGDLPDLPGKQQDLINALAEANKKVIAVIYSGGVCSVHRCIDNISGFIYAFYPGQEGGNALADILFGDVNPSGRMPVTMPTTVDQLPAWNDNFTDDYGCGYRWFDGRNFTPEFAFGHGLSYTTFEYSNLVIPAPSPYGNPVSISVDVKNSGTRSGEEVVQLYLTHDSSSIPMAKKELKGFQRVALAPGEKKTVTLTITNDELYYFNETTAMYSVEPGQITVRVGTASDSILATGSFTMLAGTQKPDLRITNLKMVPPFPLPGQKVTFVALVKNQGTGPTASGSPVKVKFSLNEKEIAWSTNYTQSIPAGGMALIEADGGPAGTNLWAAESIGTYSVHAIADPDNAIDECVESNNDQFASLTVYPNPPQNLALNKPVKVSSIEATGLEGEKAVDGNIGTRWSSAFSDPQFIVVDLGSVQSISEVLLYWETAYAKSYQVLVSDDSITFRTIGTASSSDGGLDKITTNERARFIWIQCTQRATQWGYSLFEIVVHGTELTSVYNNRGNIPTKFSLSNNFPNPFNPTTVINYQLPVTSHVTLKVYDLLGREVATLVNEKKEAGNYSVQWNAINAPSGIYFARIMSGAYSQSKKMLLVK